MLFYIRWSNALFFCEMLLYHTLVCSVLLQFIEIDIKNGDGCREWTGSLGEQENLVTTEPEANDLWQADCFDLFHVMPLFSQGDK